MTETDQIREKYRHADRDYTGPCAHDIYALLDRIADLERIVTQTGLPEKETEDDLYFVERIKWIAEHGGRALEVECLAFADYLAWKCGFEVKR